MKNNKLNIKNKMHALIMVAVLTLSMNIFYLDKINADNFGVEIQEDKQSLATEDSQKENIKFDIKQITAKKDIQGELRISVGGDISKSSTSVAIPINVKKDRIIQAAALLPSVEGDYIFEIISFDHEEPILKIAGSIFQNNEGYSHVLSDIDKENNWLLTHSNSPAIEIVMGYVEGNIIVESYLSSDTNAENCILSTNLDKNLNNIFDYDEVQNFQLKEHFSFNSSESVNRLPLHTKYEVSLICENQVVAFNKGIYDLVGGDTLETEKFRNPDYVELFGVGIERTPYVTQVSIPGYMIAPPADILKVLPKEKEKFWDVIQEKSMQELIKEKIEIEKESNDYTEGKSESSSFQNWIRSATQNSWIYFPLIVGTFFIILIIGGLAQFISGRNR